MTTNVTPLASQADIPAALPSGTTLLHGQYVIEEYLNSGGFGITYLAKDSLHRRVVIKECFPDVMCTRVGENVLVKSGAHAAQFRELVDLFVQEARSLARLSHPNIVGVHQVFEDNDTAYMALDYIEGRDLLDVADDPNFGLKPSTLRDLVLKLLDAIEFMHQQGILHRDISPDNILLGKRMEPVLIDFGAARETASRSGAQFGAMRAVKDGYSPQEFYLADSTQKPSSDFYSLGASLYHIMTGNPPPNAQERRSCIASGEEDPCVPIAKLVEGYPTEFLNAIDQALEIFPKNRPQSAADWRAMITKTRKTTATRGTVSRPMLAVDNGEVVANIHTKKADTQLATQNELMEAGIIKPKRPPHRVKVPVDRPERIKTQEPIKELKLEHKSWARDMPQHKSSGFVARILALLVVTGAGATYYLGGWDPVIDKAKELNAHYVAPYMGGILGSGETEGAAAPTVPTGGAALLPPPAAPTVSDTPAVADTPAVVETPTVVEAPVAADTPAVVEAPAIVEAPVVADTPVVIEAPTVSDAPVVVEVPTVVEAPVAEAAPTVPAVPEMANTPPAPQTEIAAPPRVTVEPGTFGFERSATVHNAPAIVQAEQPAAPAASTEVAATAIASNGMSEVILFTGDRVRGELVDGKWVVTVVDTASDAGYGVQKGDILVAVMPSGEAVTSPEDLVVLLEREHANGNTAVSIAVQRDGALWLASLDTPAN